MSAQSGSRARLPLLIAVAVGLVAGSASYAVLRHLDGAARGDCVPLEISSSTEKGDLLAELGRRYNKSDRDFGGARCATVTVHKLTSGAGMEALASGWNAERDGAPQPQVWTPTSSMWLELLRERQPAPAVAAASIAQSPLVIGMPEPMATAFGWPDRRFGWRELLDLVNDPRGWETYGHKEWGRFTFGKDNPHLSTSGLAATVATYYAGSGLSRELGVDDVEGAEVTEFVRQVEGGVLHYADDAVKFLANLTEADAKGTAMSYVSAVVMQEQLLYQYNRGNPTGDPRVTGTAPKVPLVALYPKDGTLMLDHPFVVLPSATGPQQQAAADFLAFLQRPEQQRDFAAGGFRDSRGAAGTALRDTVQVPAAQQLDLISPPAGPVLTKILKGWDNLRKKARVLLVLDVSGSMKEEATPGVSKLAAAKKAAIDGLKLLHPDDEVGLWTFSGQRPNGVEPYDERLPMSRLGSSMDALTTKINALTADGGTALYYTTRKATTYLHERVSPDRINAVVLLTDGRNEYPRDTDRAALLRDVGGSGLEDSVRVFAIAFGSQADLDTLQEIAKVTRGAAYDARDAAIIDKVFVSVLSNF